MIKKSIFLVLALMVFAGPASAAAVEWTFDITDVVGVFTFDATTGDYSDVAISVCRFDPCDTSFSTATGDAQSMTAVGDVNGDELFIDFIQPLTDLGGLVGWSGDVSNGQDTSSLSGEVSAVPLPAAAWLFGSALLGLGALKRRKA